MYTQAKCNLSGCDAVAPERVTYKIIPSDSTHSDHHFRFCSWGHMREFIESYGRSKARP